MIAGLEARAARLANRKAADARERVVAQIGDDLAGIVTRIEGEAIVLSGRGLRARLLTEPVLRWIGSLAR